LIKSPTMPKKRQLEESEEELQYVKKPKSEKSKSAKKEVGKGTDAEGNNYWEVCFFSRSVCFFLLFCFPRALSAKLKMRALVYN
jgi:hypothetical protein